VRARRDLGGDFGQVQVHRLGVASGHDEGCALAVLGADRTKDIGGDRSLIFGSARARATLAPSAGDLVLLADARLVGEPDLYRLGSDAVLACDLVQAIGETFFKILNRAGSLRVMRRTSRKLAITPWRAIPGSGSAGRRRRGIPRRSIGRDRRSATARSHEQPGSALFPALPEAIRDLNVGVIALAANILALVVVSAASRPRTVAAGSPGRRPRSAATVGGRQGRAGIRPTSTPAVR
jgi:hypothetical protein